MMKKLFLLLFFLVSCAFHLNNNVNNKKVLDFNKDLTFDEFNNLLNTICDSKSIPRY